MAHSIRSSLFRLIACGIAPILMFSAGLAVRSAMVQRDLIGSELAWQTVQLAALIDRELFVSQQPLLVLAGSEDLESGNLERFHARATRLALALGSNISLTDPTGQQLINTRFPYGTGLLKIAGMSNVEKTIRTGATAVSGVVRAASDGTPAVLVSIPVVVAGQPNYSLHMNVIGVVSGVIERQRNSLTGIASVMDADGHVLARYPSIPEAIGRMAVTPALQAVARGTRGTFDGISRDGIKTHNAFVRMDSTGWTVLIGIPESALVATTNFTIIYIAVAIIGAVAVSVMLASIFGRRLAYFIRALSRQATALKDGLVVPPLEPSGIFEIDAVGHAIYDTSNVLESRTAEREAALAALRLEVTDRRRVERQLLHAQKMDAVGRLTSGIAHDFNNILAGVVGSLEFVTDRIAGDNESLVALNSAIDTAMLGSELTGRLLAFARQQPLTSADVDVNNTVRSLVPLLRRTLGGGITVETNLRDGLWKATADPSQLQDAALNLCINARDAMPDGGVLRIETSNVTFDAAYAESNIDMVPGDYVMMAISDTGTGMSAEVQLRAFEPFFTTKEEGHGNGLGLSMVYGFVKQSAGHIKIYSECDRGTSIMLYLPRCPNEIGAPESPPRVLANPIVASGETILVVDDFDAVRGAACRSLRSLGYRVVEASSAEQALQLIDDGLAIDLLFTDIVMPGGMTGQALAREIRKRLPGTPVVLTSGYADTVDMNGGEAVTILRKPFRREELKARMKEALTMP